MEEDAEVANIAQAILRYLSRHPDASDTVEGIRQFWFAHRHPPGERVVREALQQLVRQEWVVESSSKAAKTFYSANKQRRETPEES